MAAEPNPPADPSDDWYAYYRFNPSRDSPNEARNSLLVVSALIAAATFQAGINPPGGVSQGDTTVNNVTIPAGKAILGADKISFTIFLFFNTLAFSSSVQMMAYLVYGCPFYFEVWTASVCMSLTYGFSISSVEPPGGSESWWVLVASLLPYVVRLLHQIFKKYKERG